MKLNTAIELFITARQADGRAPATIRDYCRVLNPFSEWCSQAGLRLPSLNRDLIRCYVAGLRERGWAEGHVAIHVRNLRAFLHWCADERYTRENLAQAIKAPRRVCREEMPITEEEIKKLLDTCSALGTDMSCHTPHVALELAGLRDKALILFLYDTGLRVGEVSPLRLCHLFRDEAGSYLFVYASKTKESRQAALGNLSTLALVDYLKARGEMSSDAPLFAALYEQNKPLGYNGILKMLYRRAKMAGLDTSRVHPHIFRKAFVTSFLDNGGDAERLRVLAGWKSLEMLKVYTGSNLSQLREAHRRAGPVDRMMDR